MVPLPTISIIIPTLNSARTLRECLKSIRSQDYPQQLLEIMLIDGGSSDTTRTIANEFSVRFEQFPEKKDNPEARKAIGLANAKYALALFIDSDNILPQRHWLRQMVAPLLDNKEVVASQPLRYHYDRKYSLLNRYFALFGVNDPVAYYLHKQDRLSWAEERWSLFGRACDKGDYYEVSFTKDRVPTLGANGFLARTDILRKAKVEPGLFFHIDINYDLIAMGFNTYAIVKDSIIHLTADTVVSFLVKRMKFMQRYYHQDYRLRRWRLYEPKDRYQLLVFVIISLTFIKPLYDSIKGFIKVPDVAWFLHPLVCFAILLAYGLGAIENLIVR